MSLILIPDELDAMITSGGSSSSSCSYSFCLKSSRSGPFSWTRSTPRSAVGKSLEKARRDCDAPGARPNRSSAGHAAFTKRRSEASASGATSFATTSSPFARNNAAQLAQRTPLPMIATFLIGLLFISVFLSQCFDVGDAGEIALGPEQHPLVRPIEPGDVERAGEIGDEHAVAGNIERDTDALHQIRDHDLRHVLSGLSVNRRAIHRVAAR